MPSRMPGGPESSRATKFVFELFSAYNIPSQIMLNASIEPTNQDCFQYVLVSILLSCAVAATVPFELPNLSNTDTAAACRCLGFLQHEESENEESGLQIVHVVSQSQVRPVDSIASLQKASDDQIIVFRISQKRPFLRKRPTSSVDAVRSDDVVISQYEIINSDDCKGQLTVRPQVSTNPALTNLFSGDEQSLNDLAGAMQHWRVVGGSDFQLKMPPGLSTEAEEIIDMLFHARAFSGSFISFNTAGFSAAEDVSLQHLLPKGFVVQLQEKHEIQLSIQLVVDGATVLGSPQATFAIRTGVPFEVSKITKNVKPTALEVQLRLREGGWALDAQCKRRVASYKSEGLLQY